MNEKEEKWSPINTPLVDSSTFEAASAEQLALFFSGEDGDSYIYSRSYNPTVKALAEMLKKVEEADDAYCTSSGMSSIMAAILNICNCGDHLVASHTLYGGTFALLSNLFERKFGITVTFVDITDLNEIKNAITNNTKLIYCESVANPTLEVADIPKLAEICHQHHLKLVVDNTLSPLTMKPITQGADVVVQSLTKFINGSSDLVAGGVFGSKEFISELMDLETGTIMLFGPTLDPSAASRLLKRIPHLEFRIREHSKRALAASRFLEEAGLLAIYPGLESHPQHELFKEIGYPELGYGGMYCVDLGNLQRANKFLNLLKKHRLCHIAVSLGFHDTLASPPAGTTHSEIQASEQKEFGIGKGLVRISSGFSIDIERTISGLKQVISELD